MTWFLVYIVGGAAIGIVVAHRRRKQPETKMGGQAVGRDRSAYCRSKMKFKAGTWATVCAHCGRQQPVPSIR